MSICIIPARGGSKRIPRKNIREFHGLPMIAWSIRSALRSGAFDRIVVSTDDEQIASVAAKYGAEIPFMRPAEYSDDYVGTVPVIAHAVDELALQDDEFVCCLYATAPFVRPEDLGRAQDALQGSNTADYALSVTTFGFPIQRSLRLAGDGRLDMFFPEHETSRSQDLEEAWHDAGQFYMGRAEVWRAQRPIFGSRPVPVELPRHRVQDIDTADDWERAQLMFAQLQGDAG